MPNAKVLSEKQAIVADLTEKLKKASSGVLVDYKGITVAEDTALRNELRKNGVEYAVVKNTLTLFAAKNAGFDALSPVLNGTTALAVSMDDPVAPARVLSKFCDKMQGKKFFMKAGFVDGRVINVQEIKALADLPAKEVLQAQVLGTMLAPITGLANVLNANIRGLAVALNAISEQKSA
jgi:large subunit ribosomal protein L10